MTERAEIQWGSTPIPFTVQRSDRRRTVALTMDHGRLVVTAPREVPLGRLKEVVRRKAPWVVARQRRAGEGVAPPSSREFVTGETVLYLGAQRRLRVVEQLATGRCRILGRWYEVPVRPELSPDARREAVRARLVADLRGRATLRVPTMLRALCDAWAVPTPKLLLRSQAGRWGSCDAEGVLRINWRIIQAPLRLQEYVLAHELAHLDHPTHGEAFWSTLGRRMPDYEARREQLREMGAGLVW